MKELFCPDYDDNILQCPYCEGEYLHQRQIEIFEREREDQEAGTHVVVNGEEVCIDKDLRENPSLRRQGLRIYFYCEGCDRIPALTIVQHKGNTRLEFEGQ